MFGAMPSPRRLIWSLSSYGLLMMKCFLGELRRWGMQRRGGAEGDLSNKLVGAPPWGGLMLSPFPSYQEDGAEGVCRYF